MKFELPVLPYAKDALQPAISEQTLEFHHGKHLLAYINKLNELVEGTRFKGETLEAMIRSADGAIFNNASQTWNHIFYFETFSPKGGGEPKGVLAEAISKKWGSFEKFRQEFSDAAVSLFGSGWVWLVESRDRSLSIINESNAGNPLREGHIPLLTFDVWEHAYYLDVQNRRADHIKGLWNIIDWNIVAGRVIKD
ncbi:MAG: superoxide dismutase [Prevotellaceae bacterium]|jgi:Fe-Mn family superoxide dismutase|nr:superoxide dismutase [Prevotellaceae bacterium]